MFPLLMCYFLSLSILIQCSVVQSHKWCHNQSAILVLQREQIRRARISVFGENHNGFLSHSENLNFYMHVNNNYTVKLLKNTNGYSHLIYRRLYKNANDHIRTLLFNFEHRLCNGHKSGNITNREPIQCVPHCDFSCLIATTSSLNSMMSRISAIFLPKEEKNFSFTFVREPISRFISGMTEIEYRIMKIPSRQKYLEFKNELGSYQRFQEFVDFLLLHGDFKSFLQEHSMVEIAHIAPMVGTILADPSIHLYRLEDFDQELYRLAQDVGQPDLFDLYQSFGKRNLAPHSSSRDEFNISLNSKAFLAHASPAARSYFFPSASLSSSSLSSSSSSILSSPSTTTTSTTSTSVVEECFPPHPMVSTATTANSINNTSSPRSFSAAPSKDLSFTVDRGELQQQAATYLVALCRIFLTDFLCAGYDLPQDCAFLREEAIELMEEFDVSSAAGAVMSTLSHCSDGRTDDPLCGLNVEQEEVQGCDPSEVCDGDKCWNIYI